jgi:hypothetical protein
MGINVIKLHKEHAIHTGAVHVDSDFIQVFHVNAILVPATNSFAPQAKQRKGILNH